MEPYSKATGKIRVLKPEVQYTASERLMRKARGGREQRCLPQRPWAGAGPLSDQFPIPWNGEKRISLAGRLAGAASLGPAPGPRRAFPREQPPPPERQWASGRDREPPLSLTSACLFRPPPLTLSLSPLPGPGGCRALLVTPAIMGTATCRQAEVKGRTPGSPEDNARSARPHPGEMTVWDLRLRGDPC